MVYFMSTIAPQYCKKKKSKAAICTLKYKNIYYFIVTSSKNKKINKTT